MSTTDPLDLPSVQYVEPESGPSLLNPTPEATPAIASLLAQHWYQSRTHDDDLPLAIPEAGWYRGSYAGSCTRKLAYSKAGVEKTDPPSVADHWRMDLGTMVHEQLQDAISMTMPGAEHEVQIDLNHVGIPGSMRIDSVRPLGDDDTWETVEIKTINGFAFKKCSTTFAGGPTGPRDSAAIQAALGAVAYCSATGKNVTGARIVYLSLENVSPDLAAKVGRGGIEAQFAAEWFIPFDDCIQIVAREKYRLSLMDQDPVPRIITTDVMLTGGSYVEIKNPDTGAAIDDKGNGTKAWQCSYCDYHTQCADDYRKEQ